MNYIEIRRSRDFEHVDKEKGYLDTIFIILQHREPASLKTFPGPTRCPEKGKECV
jgi:hypothetical protein